MNKVERTALHAKLSLASVASISSIVTMVAFGGTAAAAGAASFTLSPASGTFTAGSDVAITITENSGTTNTNAAEADLSYDQHVLQYVSVDGSHSTFDVEAPISAGGGIVRVPRGKIGSPLSGSQPFAIVHFKAIGNSTSSPVSLTDSSVIAETGSATANIWNGTKSSAAVAVSGATGNSFTDTTLTRQDPTVFPVAVTVTDKNGRPVSGASVSLDGTHTATTDTKGVASFASVPSGSYTAKVTTKGSTSTEPITVSKGTGVQTHSFRLASITVPTTSKVQYLVLTIVVIALLAAVLLRHKLSALLHKKPTV